MRTVRLIDTTLRDGSASLWAMEMRTHHMLPALEHLDRAGFDQIEFFAPGSRLKKFVRHLRENPWDWIKRGTALAKETPLRWHGGLAGSRMSGHFSPAVAELLVSRAVELGIRYTRLANNWNNYEVVDEQKQRLEALGMTPTVDVIYSVSPRHTDEYFIEKARQAAALQPFRLSLKDVGGLLTPERARELLPKMLAVTGDIEWEFHGHCNNGLGPLNAMVAAEVGFTYLHTAVPPLAYGDSHPSCLNLQSNLAQRGFDVPLDRDAVQKASDHLFAVAKAEGFPIGVPNPYDEYLYTHQVPGGMIANFIHQLKLVQMEDRLDEILEEVARVREDFGYPMMITPLSQIVGTQAAINVMVGERYKQVTEETIHYSYGRHGGEEAIEAMDPDVRDRILDRPRARELKGWEPPDPTLAELRERFGADISDEDLILRTIVGDDAIDVLRDAPPPRDSLSASSSLVSLVEKLSSEHGYRFVSVSNPDYRVAVRR